MVTPPKVMSPGVPRGGKKGAEQFDWFIILSVQHIELFSKAKKGRLFITFHSRVLDI